MELGRLAASAQVLLGEDVASFDVVVWLQREHGEEDEAKTLDFIFRTLGDQKEVSVQADQLLGQLLPRHLLLVPVLVSQKIINCTLIVPFKLGLLLYL